MSIPKYLSSVRDNRWSIMADRTNFGFQIGYGENMGVDVSDGMVGVWPSKSLKVFATAAETLDVVSLSGADILGGTGARIISITGLDANFNQIAEEVDMDGTNIVTTAQQYLRVNRAIVLQSGIGTSNDGDITLTGTSSTNLFDIIPSSAGLSKSTYFTVPLGYAGYIGCLRIFGVRNAGGTASIVSFKLKVKTNNYQPLAPVSFSDSTFTEISFNMDTSFTRSLELENTLFQVIPEKSDVYLTAQTDQDNTDVTAHLQMVVEQGGESFRPFL